MRVLADQSAELIDLGGLGDGNTTSIKVSLETAFRPRVDGLVERLLGGERGAICGAGIGVAGLGGCGTVGGSGRARNVVTKNISAVLANQGTKLVDLGALGNCVVRVLLAYHLARTISHIL